MSINPAHNSPSRGHSTTSDLQAFFDSRSPYREAFLADVLSGADTPVLIGEDWGTRRYYRARKGDESYILMESVPDHLPFAAPGHKIADFMRLSHALNDAGLHAPAVIAAKESDGFVLMEDMGDTNLFVALDKGQADQKKLYTAAVDVLKEFQTLFPNNALQLPSYYDSHVHRGRQRIIDWYLPVLRGQLNDDSLADNYLKIWDEIETGLPPVLQGFVHGDYHGQNLMWLDRDEGLRRIGILDFQGAMWGPLAYDLANLLGDIRRDIPESLEEEMLSYRIQGMKAEDKESFLAWYPVLKLQFHCRIIGQVIRLALVHGKEGHLKHMPRLQSYVKRGLENPIMEPLKAFFDEQGAVFDHPLPEHPDQWRAFIRPDAF